jgi:NADH-ubiquinone oxidoreductase chain 5
MINLIALDMLMSIGFFAVFSIFGSLNYSEVFSLVPYLNEVAITIIALFLLGGALAKSANIPLHSWLPGSMVRHEVNINNET